MIKRKTSSLKVVLADDEPLALLRLDRCLARLGCEVLAKFAHGGDLVAWLQTHDMPDALFLDVQIPGASGLDILAEFSYQVAFKDRDPPRRHRGHRGGTEASVILRHGQAEGRFRPSRKPR